MIGIKKKIAVGVLAALVVGTVGISAKAWSDKIAFDRLPQFEKVANIVERHTETDAEFNDIMYDCKYIELGIDAPSEHLDYIYNLIINGCDSEAIIDLYYFWLDTNEDISIIEEMYNLKEKYEGYKYWIENAFDDVTAQKNGSLDVETVESYIDKGLSIEDIEIADKLCRKGVYRIEEILDKKLGGKSLAEMACESYGESLDSEIIEVISEDTDHAKKLEKRIGTAINLSRINGKGISSVLKLAADNVDIEEMYYEENAEKAVEVFRALCKENIYKFDDRIKENKELFDKARGGADNEEILDMMKDGLSDLDIVNKLNTGYTEDFEIEEVEPEPLETEETDADAETMETERADVENVTDEIVQSESETVADEAEQAEIESDIEIDESERKDSETIETETTEIDDTSVEEVAENE